MKTKWAAGVVVLVLAAAAATAGAQSSAPTLQWEWESDLAPQSPGRWGLAALRNGEHEYCTGRMWGSSSSNVAISLWRVNGDGSLAWILPIIPAGSTDCKGVAVTAVFDPVSELGIVWVSGVVDGANGKDIFTACYRDRWNVHDPGDPNDPPFELLWQDRYNNEENGINGDDVPVGILYDSVSGKVFVGGDSDGANIYSQSSGTDIVVLAYPGIGVGDPPNNPPTWVLRYDGTGLGDDHFADFQVVYEAVAPATGTFVGFYVAGTAWNSGTKNDFVALSLDIFTNNPNGSIIAQRDYNYNESGHDICTCIDAAQWGEDENGFVGGVFLGGYTSGLTTNGNDYLTVAFDLHLNEMLLWVPRTYDGPGAGSDKIAKIAYWTDGTSENRTVTVTGESLGDGTGFDFATTRYKATDGDDFWTGSNVVRRFDNPTTNGEDRATDMVVDKDGNVYVGGFSEHTMVSTTLDFAAISYEWETGDSRWLDLTTMRDFITYNGTANGTDRSAAIRVTRNQFGQIDPGGDVFLYGSVTAVVNYTTAVRHAVVKWAQ